MKFTIMSTQQPLSALPLPLFSALVPAGFPSPADDYIERALDINEYLVTQPASTFFVKASGKSMVNAGIMDEAILVASNLFLKTFVFTTLHSKDS